MGFRQRRFWSELLRRSIGRLVTRDEAAVRGLPELIRSEIVIIVGGLSSIARAARLKWSEIELCVLEREREGKGGREGKLT